MDKKNKKILITIASLLILAALLISVGVWYYWNTNPEPICNRNGGFWTGVYEGENLCDRGNKQSDKLIFGCECGPDKCWNGKKCIEITK